MNDSSTVFVIDNDPGSRDSLRQLLESAGLRTETFGTGREFLGICDPTRRGCLIAVMGVSGLDGPAFLDQLSACDVMLPVIVLMAHADVPAAVRAMKSGAADFMPIPFPESELLHSVRRCIEDDRRARHDLAKRVAVTLRVKRLTPRERQVMDLVVTGKANRQVAVELGCSCKTVEVHRSRVMDKMEVGSVAELVRMAMLIADPGRTRKGEGAGNPLWIGRPFESMDMCAPGSAASTRERLGPWQDDRPNGEPNRPQSPEPTNPSR